MFGWGTYQDIFSHVIQTLASPTFHHLQGDNVLTDRCETSRQCPAQIVTTGRRGGKKEHWSVHVQLDHSRDKELYQKTHRQGKTLHVPLEHCIHIITTVQVTL